MLGWTRTTSGRAARPLCWISTSSVSLEIPPGGVVHESTRAPSSLVRNFSQRSRRFITSSVLRPSAILVISGRPRFRCECIDHRSEFGRIGAVQHQFVNARIEVGTKLAGDLCGIAAPRGLPQPFSGNGVVHDLYAFLDGQIVIGNGAALLDEWAG